MRKKIVSIFFLFGNLFVVVGQSTSNYISYEYDAAGNRTSRMCLSVTLRSAIAPTDSSEVSATIDEIKVIIYPNPTKGTIIAGLSTFDPKVQVSFMLFTSDGKKLQQLNAESDQTPINLSSYNPGIYLLKISTKDKELEFKIIKQ